MAEAQQQQIPKEITKDAQDVATRAKQMLALARDFKVTDQASLEAAGEDLKRVKGLARELSEKRLAITRPIDAAKKAVMDFFREPEQFLADAERIIKRGVLAYQDEQDRKAREEQRRLEEIARKEQEKLQRQAEKRAERQEAKGNADRAEEIRAAVPVISTPIVVPQPTKVAGIAVRETWSAEVTDIKALCRAVADGAAPANLVEPNMKVLNTLARSLKAEMRFPGVRAVSEKGLSARAAG
jgi:hypothetical protein